MVGQLKPVNPLRRSAWSAITALILSVLLTGQAQAIGADTRGTQAYIKQDYDQALAIWQDQANAGDPSAMFGMGLLYAHGRGVEANTGQAMRWYRLACDKDYIKGCYNAGLLEIDAAREPAAFSRARGYLAKAAELGHPSSQHRLAIMYLRGEGSIQKNEAEAKFWLEQAELADHRKSRELLNYVRTGGNVASAPDAEASAENDGENATDGTFGDVLAQAKANQVASLFGSANPGTANEWAAEDDRKREEEMRKNFRQGAKRNCALSPDIPWWGNNSHEAIKTVVETQYQGNWTTYFQKWSRYKSSLEKGLANKKVAKVKEFGITLKGPTLGGYIKNIDKRLSVIRCLASEESGQNIADE